MTVLDLVDTSRTKVSGHGLEFLGLGFESVILEHVPCICLFAIEIMQQVCCPPALTHLSVCRPCDLYRLNAHSYRKVGEASCDAEKTVRASLVKLITGRHGESTRSVSRGLTLDRARLQTPPLVSFSLSLSASVSCSIDSI